MTKPITRHRLKSGPKPKVDLTMALPVLAESTSIKQAARNLGVHHRTLQNALERAEYKLAEPDRAEWICPKCSEPGTRAKSRTICNDCKKSEARADYHRENTGEPATKWDKALASKYASMRLVQI